MHRHGWAVTRADEHTTTPVAVEAGAARTAAEAWEHALSATAADVNRGCAGEWRIRVDDATATLRPGMTKDGHVDIAAALDALDGLRASMFEATPGV